MKAKNTLYRSYLLRLYGTVRAGELIWRASLDNPAGGDKLRFSSIEALFQYLQDQCTGLEAGNALSEAEE